MSFHRLFFLCYSDLYRYSGITTLRSFLKNIMLNPGYKYSFFLRLTAYLSQTKFNPFFLISYFILRHYRYKYGIEISHKTVIGSGLYISHFSGIIVNHSTIIGENCTVCQGVTIGYSNRGKNKGTPIIGDNVYIGPGAKVFGGINIGNNVAIGANCVVTKDIPDNAVVVGVPGKVISYKGSEGYSNFTDYKKKDY